MLIDVVFRPSLHMIRMSLNLVLILNFAVTVIGSGGEDSIEPLCTSRFDYDYKVISKLVSLETEQKKLHDIIAKQQQMIERLRQTSQGE